MILAVLSLALPLQDAPRWRPITEEGAPPARTDETVVWTGTEALVFGGWRASQELGDGAAYDPATDRWRALASEDAPDARAWHSAVWTGREMIVWGGVGPGDEGEVSGGAAYDPHEDTWRTLSDEGAPAARGSHLAAWAGDRMWIWAGVTEFRAFASGATYDPREDRWRGFELDLFERIPRSAPTVEAGARVLAWGGINGGAVLDDGLVWSADDARSMNADGAPAARAFHSLVWTGDELIVWGGSASILGRTNPFGDGARYDPDTDRWQSLETRAAPSPRSGHAAIWTAGEMWVIGGRNEAGALADVHAWSPSRGWRRLPGLPEPRTYAHAFATPRGVLVIGGSTGDEALPGRMDGFLLPVVELGEDSGK